MGKGRISSVVGWLAGGRGRIAWGDVAVAVGVAVVMVSTALSKPHTGEGWGYALLAAGGLALIVKRMAPIPVLVMTGLLALGYQAAGLEVLAVSYLVAVYAAVRAGHRLVTAVVSVLLLIGITLIALASTPDGAMSDVVQRSRGVMEIAWLIAAAAAGEAVRQAEKRADEAERSREETARRRANEERLHIARELHDSLTHQISIIKVQSEVAVHIAQRRGEPVPEALLAIREAGREATRELRATLEALRDEDQAPPRGLEHLPDLVAGVSKTGLAATLTVEGQRADVPAAVQRTAYRVVQESLTNVARHAAATTATVHIGYGPELLAVRIDDDGKATSDSAVVPGVGLLGMRERVTALGGRLEASPRRDGGFSVLAELPVERAA